ncbi:SMC-Scp complex subunit ScpB [Pseudomaricurvus alcaniphilus]|uniref:SMC-Scp complex subunit ScpB n=1 Tax=Pseudomaricurvus alcaniphilus TaxID=1166482 RepID=UPI001FB7FD81|nr:SMC-Scp complex subunit ScpB [Pseudomaricurvus alcaniphilus]
MNIDRDKLRQIIEGALLAAGQPLSRERLLLLFEGDDEVPEKDDIQSVLEDIQADCRDRGYELAEVASGWRFQVRAETAPWVNRLWEEKPQKYSRALLETLALIAYRQPITRGDIEEIRGVAVSSHIIKTLVEREWVKVVGQRDVPGRPSLYATTRHFLDYFNLKSLDELPTLSEIRDLDELNSELDLQIESSLADNSPAPKVQPEMDSEEDSAGDDTAGADTAGDDTAGAGEEDTSNTGEGASTNENSADTGERKAPPGESTAAAINALAPTADNG